VPGHGVVADRDRVKLTRECIEAVVTVVREAQAAGEELDDHLMQRLPEPFKSWGRGGPG